MRMHMTQDASVKRLIWGSVEDHASMPLDVHAHWSDVARRLMLQPMQIMSLLQLRVRLLNLNDDPERTSHLSPLASCLTQSLTAVHSHVSKSCVGLFPRSGTLDTLSTIYAQRKVFNQELAHLCEQGQEASTSTSNRGAGGAGALLPFSAQRD